MTVSPWAKLAADVVPKERRRVVLERRHPPTARRLHSQPGRHLLRPPRRKRRHIRKFADVAEVAGQFQATGQRRRCHRGRSLALKVLHKPAVPRRPDHLGRCHQACPVRLRGIFRLLWALIDPSLPRGHQHWALRRAALAGRCEDVGQVLHRQQWMRWLIRQPRPRREEGGAQSHGPAREVWGLHRGLHQPEHEGFHSRKRAGVELGRVGRRVFARR
jgi:hypothetical protein